MYRNINYVHKHACPSSHFGVMLANTYANITNTTALLQDDAVLCRSLNNAIRHIKFLPEKVCVAYIHINIYKNTFTLCVYVHTYICIRAHNFFLHFSQFHSHIAATVADSLRLVDGTS